MAQGIISWVSVRLMLNDEEMIIKLKLESAKCRRLVERELLKLPNYSGVFTIFRMIILLE